MGTCLDLRYVVQNDRALTSRVFSLLRRERSERERERETDRQRREGGGGGGGAELAGVNARVLTAALRLHCIRRSGESNL